MDAPHHRGGQIVTNDLALPAAAMSILLVIATGLSHKNRVLGCGRPIINPGEFETSVATNNALELPGRRAGGNPLQFSPRSRWVLATLAVLTGVVWLSPLPVLILVVSGLGISRAVPQLKRRRGQRSAERELPGTIELLVLSIHAGLTPTQALREVANSAHEATRPAFVEVVHRMDRGEPISDALTALPEVLGSQAVGLAEVTASATRYGLPLSQVLDQLSSEARSTRRRLDEAAARKLPVRLSFPLVVCTLPSFVLLAIAPAVIAALSSLGASAP